MHDVYHAVILTRASVHHRVCFACAKMEDNNGGNAQHGGRAAPGPEGAEFQVGIQHGSAAGSDPAGPMPTASPVDLAAATIAAVNFGTSPSTRRKRWPYVVRNTVDVKHRR